MDRYEIILASMPGLARKLEAAGVEEWLDRQRTVTIEGQTFFLLGDRRATRPEAMLWFADEQGLVTPDELRAADSAQPLPSDVEGVEVDSRKGDK